MISQIWGKSRKDCYLIILITHFCSTLSPIKSYGVLGGCLKEYMLLRPQFTQQLSCSLREVCSLGTATHSTIMLRSQISISFQDCNSPNNWVAISKKYTLLGPQLTWRLSCGLREVYPVGTATHLAIELQFWRGILIWDCNLIIRWVAVSKTHTSLRSQLSRRVSCGFNSVYSSKTATHLATELQSQESISLVHKIICIFN